MTDIQKLYNGLLKEVSGKDWKKEESFKIGHAGLAVAVSVLQDGQIKLKHLLERIPDFSQTEIRMALSNLKKNGFFAKEDGRFKLVVDSDKGCGVESLVFWALLVNVAQGFIERTSEGEKTTYKEPMK